MSTFLEVEQLWVVNEDDANHLLKIGWKFLQAVVSMRGEINSSFLGSGGGGDIKSSIQIVMGRPKGVPEKLNEDYYPRYYFQRLEKASSNSDKEKAKA